MTNHARATKSGSRPGTPPSPFLAWCRCSAKSLFDEHDERSGLRADESASGKDCPKPDRRQRPFGQHRPDRAALQLWREHPFGCNRESGMSKDCGADALSRSDAQSAAYRHLGFCAATLERPVRSPDALIVDDALTRAQIRRCGRNTRRRQVHWRPQHQAGILGDLSSRHCARIPYSAHAECDVDALLEQIDFAIVQHDIEAQIWVLGEEGRDRRHYAKPGERDTRADPEHARETDALATRLEFGVLGRFDCAFRSLIEPLAGLRGVQAVRRANEQPDAEPGLELRNSLRDR